MKKLFSPFGWCVLGVLLFWILVATSVFALTKTLNFGWQQASADLPNLATWRIYSSSTAGGPYALLTQIAYDGQAKPEYTGTATITQADNTAKTYYFICRAVGKNGNESGNSNEVSAVIDLIAPSTPVQFKVTISN
jgi:hypothetical protein